MIRINAKPIVAGGFATLLVGSTALSTPALADPKPFFSDLEEDGSVISLYHDEEDGHIYYIEWSADGKTCTVYDPGNPNPDGDATGKGSHSDKPDVVALIKSGAATYQVHIAPADSAELMGHLQSVLDGGGLAAHYNPSDDDNGSGPGATPSHSMQVKKTPDEIRQEIAVANEIAGELATIEAAMGDGSEGGSESPTGANKNGKPGGTGDDSGNYTEGQNKTVGKTEKDLLGPVPQVVNPPHQSSNGASMHGSLAGNAGGGTHGGLGGGAHTATGMH